MGKKKEKILFVTVCDCDPQEYATLYNALEDGCDCEEISIYEIKRKGVLKKSIEWEDRPCTSIKS